MTEIKKSNTKVPAGCISLQFAGELILPKLKDTALQGAFKRYAFLFETLANLSRDERLLGYQLINALALTSHARKTTDRTEKKALFALKNAILVHVLTTPTYRRNVATRYLKSKNFLVKKYCATCVENNQKSNLEKHRWKFCKKCDVDKNFFDVLSLQHKFPAGQITLFLGRELLSEIKGLNLAVKGKVSDVKEEAEFNKYRFNPKNLDAIDLESLKVAQKKLLSMA